VLLGDGGYVGRNDGVVQQVRTIDGAAGGADVIRSGDGNDVIIGGAEGDDIEVGLGSDIVLGDSGEVNLNNTGAGAANDIRSIDGAIGGDDTIIGGAGVSVLIGGFGADRITTGAGSATIIGDNGAVLRDGAGTVLQVRTTDTESTTGGVDRIVSQGGANIVLGGVGGDLIDAALGSNIVLGDNGVVNVGLGGVWDIETSDPALGGDDTITGGANNTILGGAGEDIINLGGGSNTVVGDEGAVRRSGPAEITRVATTGTMGARDIITSTGGTNIILGGAGGDFIDAAVGSNIVLGDNGTVNVDGDVVSDKDVDGGADEILGGADNIIVGGRGDDRITLQGGTNIVLGDNGIVRRTGGAATQVKTTDVDAVTGGDDHITSLGGDNILIGGVGDDVIDAAAGTNIVLGDNGEVNVGGDVFTTETGLGGDDVITGGAVQGMALLVVQQAGAGASNIILGGFGADDITLGSGTNTVLGDNGIVRRDAQGAVLEVETSDTGDTSGGVDTITSLGGENIILGGVGGDLISAPFGTNIILGDNGRVTLEAGEPVQVVTTDPLIGGDDVIEGGGGNNILIGGAGTDTITGGAGSDVVVGDNGIVERTASGWKVTSLDEDSGGADVMHGGDGDDTLWGGGGDDELHGDLGDDTLHGQGGNDLLIGDVGRKVGKDVVLLDVASVTGEVSFTAGPSGTVVEALIDADLVLLAGRTSAEARALLLTLSRDGNDTITGGEGDDSIFGQRGDDTLSGNAGNDFISGGTGNDRAYGDEGNDTVVGDDAYVDSALATVPNVTHGLLIGGETIVPMVQLAPGATPNAMVSVLPQAFSYAPAGNKLGELVAYASVVTGFAGHLELVRGNAQILLPVGDVEGMAARTIEILKDDEHHRALGRAGRCRVAALFDADRVVSQYARRRRRRRSCDRRRPHRLRAHDRLRNGAGRGPHARPARRRRRLLRSRPPPVLAARRLRRPRP
jgi:Ca2+-binding RTX toxin-like protein